MGFRRALLEKVYVRACRVSIPAGCRLRVRSSRTGLVSVCPQCLQERIFKVRLSGVGRKADGVRDALIDRLLPGAEERGSIAFDRLATDIGTSVV